MTGVFLNFETLFHVAAFTFWQATCSTLMALLIGLPAAFFCGRRNFFGRRALLFLSVVPFCVPSLIIALGYVTFLGLNGGLNHFLMFIFGLKEPPLKILYSFYGLIIAHGFYNFPLIMKTVGDAWEQLPCEQAENARLLGANEFRIFKTVTIYQLMPSIASSSMLVFIYCFLSFIMVLLFGGVGNSTLEVEIYKAARASLNLKQAGLLAAVETGILCIITTFYCILEQKSSKAKGLSSSIKNPRKKMQGFAEYVVFIIVILLIILFFISPLMGIVYNAFTSSKVGTGVTLSSFGRVFKMRSFIPSIKSTLIVGLYTGALCTFIGFAYSVFLRFQESKSISFSGLTRGSLFFKVLPMLPMSISSVVLGVLITMIVRRGNVACLVIAQSLLSWPLAFRMIYPFMIKIDNQTIDSAKMLSRNRIDTVIRILLPVSKKGLISAFGFCFAVSAGDTTLPLVLAIPKFNTLSLFTYRLAGAYRFNEACASGVILGLLCIIVFVISSTSRNERNGKKKK